MRSLDILQRYDWKLKILVVVVVQVVAMEVVAMEVVVAECALAAALDIQMAPQPRLVQWHVCFELRRKKLQGKAPKQQRQE